MRPLLLLTALLAACHPSSTHADGPLPDGLYLRSKLSSSARFNQLNLVLIAGDRIAWNATGGVDPFDYTAAEQRDAKSLGHFTIKGDAMEIQWDGGYGPQTSHLEYRGGKVRAIDYGGLIKAEPYPANTRLDATFSGTISLVESGITVGSTSSITFTKSGQFTLGHQETGVAPSFSANGSSTRTGTYQLSGNTLTLKFTDGATEKHTVIPIKSDSGNPTDEAMIFEESWLKRAH